MVDQGVEREDKFEVTNLYRLPELAELAPAGGRVDVADFHIQNTYFDTASSHLARFGVTLRRREGGADAGWHLKVPAHDGRNEITDGTESPTMPDDIARLVVGLQAGEELTPVAQVTVDRTVHQLVGDDGAVLVEVADDRVNSVTMGGSARISAWREIEVEEKSKGSGRLRKQVGRRLLAAGAVRSDFGSKLQRTLGFPPHARTAPDLATVGGLAWAYVAAQCAEMVRCDIGLRLHEPRVHKYRVAIRRLRSTVKVFTGLFEPEASAGLDAELVWFAGLLGEVRDRDILLARLAGQVAELPAEVVLGSVAAHLETTLLLERSEHQSRVVEAMAGERYQGLVKQVLRWQTRPPLTKRAGRPAAEADRYLRRAEKKVNRHLAHVGGDVAALHAARKAAKRYRYAAELTAQTGGKKAARIVKNTKQLQTLLGEHQDSVISAAFLRQMGAEAAAGGEQNGFTYGFLMAREWERADRIRAQAAKRWGKKGC